MQNSSRMEKHCEKAIEMAKKGSWGTKLRVFPSEAKRIARQWKADVTIINNEDDRGVWLCNVSWHQAFENKEKFTIQQSWYMSKIVDEIPETENFAQKLFLISARNQK